MQDDNLEVYIDKGLSLDKEKFLLKLHQYKP